MLLLTVSGCNGMNMQPNNVHAVGVFILSSILEALCVQSEAPGAHVCSPSSPSTMADSKAEPKKGLLSSKLMQLKFMQRAQDKKKREADTEEAAQRDTEVRLGAWLLGGA